VTFSGSTPATFAFSAVPCAIDSDGSVVFGLTTDQLTFGEQEPRPAKQAPVVAEEGLLVDNRNLHHSLGFTGNGS
jgi:hypothetical protein